MSDKTELTKSQPTATPTPAPDTMALLQQAMERGLDPESLRQFMELAERREKAEAKRLYDQAMAAFKAAPPRIVKDMQVSFQQTSYRHASLGNVTSKVSEALSEHGLSASWRTHQQGDAITVTCVVSHVAGHSESTSLAAAPDKSGAKNPIQAVGSTVSYLERYTMLSLLGLATYEQDDDGRRGAGTSDEPITPDQATILETLIDEVATEKHPADKLRARLLKWGQVESVANLPARMYEQAVANLEGMR